ncbi:MAG: single-stranded-DNA-specific exonuclease RecJ [Bacteroidetes bacterium]|nr:single-stranded-DNA-specific exonuclease RecJ [Bacteroidota bacterium]MBU1371159.1 single-stranded-DNA-specific exonuclease RecJ [Bacteroidota bacterium]MBU1486183.1 single-stranded-DNA-specific exonuclease RecJ [Bacteroidota bacterium]MBU1762196.1 single-stranded-DNA-specific exonuclease RecJ [Bacteroidota bacterium]MBU2046887.1 single-stranded-DNA-specific exonuclease RecJ [Bacteroidota bacterium]
MEKRWVAKEKADGQTVEKLSKELNLDKVLAEMLVRRGVYSFEEAKSFFRPDIRHLHDPFLMKDMPEAIERIERAIRNEEHILIYGDYDVDGTTSVALTYSFFKQFHSKISYYIPDRYKEGYGISTDGIDYASANDYSLIIALDCGIKSVDKVAYASAKGIDFIICDHHLPGDEIPAAVAVLDPKRKDCEYPYKELSGCGLGFKLIQAYAEKNDIDFSLIEQYLDLVVVSIASDIVPITGENRTLAYFGLKKLNENPCKGLQALRELSGKTDDFTITDIVFSIGPRINAAGRIDDAKKAVQLLIADSTELAEDAGFIINLKNAERRDFDSNITEQALNMILNSPEMEHRKSTVVYHETWHKGVIGIVASRLTEKYYRPTIVLTKSNDMVAGSARSVVGYDLYEALSECSDLLEQFGGHKYAAGLTMKPENVVAFSQRFEEVVSASITDDLLTQEISIDEELDLAQINPKFYRILTQFSPFGPQNMAPVFISKNVNSYGYGSIVGNNHLKMTVRQPSSPIFDCIAFGLGEDLEQINRGKPFDICYTIEQNVWKDKKKIQLNIKGIKTY